jgi:hypothetical protein
VNSRVREDFQTRRCAWDEKHHSKERLPDRKGSSPWR